MDTDFCLVLIHKWPALILIHSCVHLVDSDFQIFRTFKQEKLVNKFDVKVTETKKISYPSVSKIYSGKSLKRKENLKKDQRLG